MMHTVVGKMDGERMLPLPEDARMTSSNTPVPGDIIEVLGRFYRVVTAYSIRCKTEETSLIDVTQAFTLLEGGNDGS